MRVLSEGQPYRRAMALENALALPAFRTPDAGGKVPRATDDRRPSGVECADVGGVAGEGVARRSALGLSEVIDLNERVLASGEKKSWVRNALWSARRVFEATRNASAPRVQRLGRGCTPSLR